MQAFRSRLVARVAWAAVLAAALAAAAAAQAQTPFQLPPVPAAGSTTGAAAAGLGVDTPVQVQRVRFDGLRSLPEAELQPLAAPFIGRPLRALELEELRQRVTRALVERGFVASGALLPAALEADGTLALRIVEGELGAVRANGLEGLDPAYLDARLRRRGEPLDVNRVQERFQLLLADPLFTRLNARLLPGDEPGRALLDIDVQRARPWQLGLFANNHLAPAVGSAVAGVDGSIRNLTGWGDTLAATLYRSDGAFSHDTSFALPLFARHTTATLRVARTNSSVVEEQLRDLDIDSLVATREFGLSHTIIDDARKRWSVGLTHVLRHNATTVLGGEPYFVVADEITGTSRIEALRLQQDLTLRFDRHVAALRASWIQGRANTVPVREEGSDVDLVIHPPRYRLWQLQGQLALALPREDAQLVLRGQLQRSPDRLLPLEQMAVGGRHTVRGYRENTLVRDNAWSVGAELHWPLWRDEARRGRVALVPFIDAGGAWNRGEGRDRLASAGLGLVFGFADLEGELFVARRLERRPVDTRGDLQDHGIHLALRYRLF